MKWIHFVLSICAAFGAQAQFQYAASLPGIGSGSAYDAISTLDGGQVVCGAFTDSMDLDPGTGVYIVSSLGGDDAWVAKYDVSGAFVWGLSLGSTGDDQARAITIDENGDVHIAGYFVNTIDLDPGVGVSLETSAGDRDVFLLKLDGNGQHLWSGRIGGTLRQFPTGIDRDLAGNIYLCGYIAGTADFDPGPGTLNVSTTNPGLITETNISFLAKYDLNGNPVWAYTLGGLTPHIAVEQGGNAIYFTNGHAANNLTQEDFDPGSGFLPPVSGGQGESDYMSLVKYDGSANVLWSVFVRGLPSFANNSNKGHALALDANGDVYWAGVFIADFTLYPGNDVTLDALGTGTDGFLLKYSNSGSLLWEKRFGAPNADDFCWDLLFGSDSLIWVTGGFHDTAELNSVGPSATATSAGEWDIFLAAFDPMGGYAWHGSAGGPDFDGNVRLTEANNQIRMSGYFSDIADLDPTSGVNALTAVGPDDVFISSFTPVIATSTVEYAMQSASPKAYPNPASNMLFVAMPDASSRIEVLDALGQRVAIAMNDGNIDVSAWPEGLYFLRGGSNASVRFMVVH